MRDINTYIEINRESYTCVSVLILDIIINNRTDKIQETFISETIT